ncbi:unnamed protein product [Effrenium voratum]|nr:unnamed protein product [Effrenium voratum]
MEAFLAQYDQQRALAEADDAVVLVAHPDLDVDQTLEPSQTASQPAALSEASLVLLNEVCAAWMPPAMSRMYGPGKEGSWNFQVDTEHLPAGLAEQMDMLRDKIDAVFAWHGKRLSQEWRHKRAAAQATLLLLESPADDSKNELLHTKLFTLLLGERYRSHGDVLFTYSQGAWQPATSGAIAAVDFEFLSLALRRAQCYFWAVGRNQIDRDFHKVAWELQVIYSLPSDEALLEWQLSEVNNLKAEQKSKSWWLGLSELCRELRKVLADHCRSVIKSFLRWSDSPMQVEREFQQQGHQFFSCVWLTFDECRRDQGVIEDLLKLFTSGGHVPLRRNHEQETRYFSWAFCAKAWLMNAADIPIIPSALETSHARRLRCSYLRNTLTQDLDSVDIKGRVFLADQDAKTFCASPTAVWTFLHDWVFPFMQHNAPAEWYSILTPPPDGSLAAKDTQWLLHRMARLTEAATPDDMQADGHEPQGFQNSHPGWEVQCHIHLQRLESYTALRVDARPDQVQQLLHLAQAQGAPSHDGLVAVKQVGYKKLVAGAPLGRHFFPHASVSSLTRHVKLYALIMVKLAQSFHIHTPNLIAYMKHKSHWRAAVAKYYHIEDEEAKEVLMRAVFGFAGPMEEHAKQGVLPLLHGLAAESAEVRNAVCADKPEILAAMKVAKKPRPETSALAFILFDEEDRAMRHLVNLLPDFGWFLVAPVFDAVLAAPKASTVLGTEGALKTQFELDTGLRLHMKPIHAER